MKQKTIAILILVLAALVALLIILKPNQASTDTSANTNISTISSPKFSQYIEAEKPVIIDIRTAEEFAGGHLEGAINIDFYQPDFREKLAALDKGQSYAVYCRSDNRSGQTLPVMRQLGFKQVAELDGGILAWTKNQLPLCTTDC